MTLLNKILQLIGHNVIVEHGMQGIYSWDKYANGEMRVWGKYTETLSAITTINGFHIRKTSAIALPTGFIGAPIILATFIPVSRFGFFATAEISATSVTLYGASELDGSLSCTFDVEFIGKWK